MLICVFFASILVFSCIEIEDYPDIPDISFKEVLVKDSLDKLDNRTIINRIRFHLIDGDGDVGYTQKDTLGAFHRDSPFYYNLFVDLYKKKKNKYLRVELDSISAYRIPKIKQQKKRALKAEIQIDYFHDFASLKFDTVRYELYMYDRALNQSNIIVTPDIPLLCGDTLIKN